MSGRLDPDAKGQRVYLSDSPGTWGVTVGRTRGKGPRLLVGVELGPNDTRFYPYGALALMEESEDPLSQISGGIFGGPSDLRRLITFEKVRGELTNVFYSMETSNTDFYPHQFKPVLAFVESSLGRLLIADEVGLGKTIEALHIWREIQARSDARRLLVVCPSMLRTKWQRDLRDKFDIDARIVDARELSEMIRQAADHPYQTTFAAIASIEGVRPPVDYLELDPGKSARIALSHLLADQPAQPESARLDLTVIDEAHYLRNPSTASNRIGRLLRDASRHLLLLTATPIQTRSENLYHMLRLLDPETFSTADVFGSMLEANRPIIAAQRALWASPPQIDQCRLRLEDALNSRDFRNDPIVTGLLRVLRGKSELDTHERVELGRRIETCSLLSKYVTRTRKRDVLERRVIRRAESLEISLNEKELALYKSVTAELRSRSQEAGEFGVFRLIARQRQLASSIPATLRAWSSHSVDDTDYLWEDLGIDPDGLRDDQDARSRSIDEMARIVAGEDIDWFERHDTKFDRFLSAIRGSVENGEKLIVFAYYRATLSYLHDRLEQNGIRCSMITGGMGLLKDDIIEEFAEPDGPRVLLSSEVGSEGIDLQFCRIIVNYDMPWNPMRVEQRIGRVDRLGQESDTVSIVNFFMVNTIEDRVLKRLLDRIRIFRESIGDIEQIIGSVTEDLVRTMMDPALSDDERERKALAAEQALENTRAEQDRLESEAINLLGYADYLTHTINDARSSSRAIGSDELLEFVSDFFVAQFPGTVLTRSGEDSAISLALSEDARRQLREHENRARLPHRTRLTTQPGATVLYFDPRSRASRRRGAELVDMRHPLIQFIKTLYEQQSGNMSRSLAIRLPEADAPVGPCDIAFAVQRWDVRCSRDQHKLAFQAVELEEGRRLSPQESERLVLAGLRNGRVFGNARAHLGDLSDLVQRIQTCEELLSERYDEFVTGMQAENDRYVEQQRRAAQSRHETTMAELMRQREDYERRKRKDLLPMTDGRIRKEKEVHAEKLSRLEKQSHIREALVEVAQGAIRVE